MSWINFLHRCALCAYLRIARANMLYGCERKQIIQQQKQTFSFNLFRLFLSSSQWKLKFCVENDSENDITIMCMTTLWNTCCWSHNAWINKKHFSAYDDGKHLGKASIFNEAEALSASRPKKDRYKQTTNPNQFFLLCFSFLFPFCLHQLHFSCPKKRHYSSAIWRWKVPAKMDV